LSLKRSGALALLSLVLLLAGLTTHDAQPARSRMSAFPKLFLWAWEREERLEFINPREVGVAFLAETIYLSNDRIVERPRLQPLKVPNGTTLIAVVRIESEREAQAALTDRQRGLIVEALNRIARQQKVAALQIDFDATMSERDFYRKLLQDTRRRLPESMPLSMTALASWCIFDDWISDLPVDEAVPMFFQMGLDEERVKNYFKAGGEIRPKLCRASVGVSTDEMTASLLSLSSSGRIYIFNSQPWTEASVHSVLERNRYEKLVP